MVERSYDVSPRIIENIFAPNGGYCVYNPSNILRNTRDFENWGVSFTRIFLISTTSHFYENKGK